ncbi:MAG: DUF2314 domain-containing protein [Planctomycetes bacterium]|nr:DUF2314 domain-containing protein [Planctomycetota bacterium]
MAQVYFVPDKDPEMQSAIERARETFRYFWRELAWEQRRIIPGLSLAAVKVPFSDPPEIEHDEEEPAVEQMWLSDIEFDGSVITGTLLNEPHWLKSISEGDQSQVPISGISDWMYAISDRVYGAYTVNLLRSQMSRGERAQHDAAWGLDFGDPDEIEVVPPEWLGKKPKPGFFKRLFGGGGDEAPPLDLETAEHPMAVNMADSLKEYLGQDPMNVHATDDNGWTMLHQQALAGTAIGVSILLEHGADPDALTSDGATALQLAESLGWKQVVDVLTARGAT